MNPKRPGNPAPVYRALLEEAAQHVPSELAERIRSALAATRRPQPKPIVKVNGTDRDKLRSEIADLYSGGASIRGIAALVEVDGLNPSTGLVRKLLTEALERGELDEIQPRGARP